MNEQTGFQLPSEEVLSSKINEYLDKNWETILADISTLVSIPSVEDAKSKTDGAPFGLAPKQALDKTLEIANNMGFETHNCEAYIGYADMQGTGGTQVGIICHTDVVPAGSGWDFNPFELTRKEGWLIGRGVLDDKGPLVIALHALKLWQDMQKSGVCSAFPHTVRFLFGANEETGMADVHYYKKHHEDPNFLFTPDASFPVCNGEKGVFQGMLISREFPFENRCVLDIAGGDAVNAVPASAYALVRSSKTAAQLPSASNITVEDAEFEGIPCVRVTASGKSAHASTPEQGVSAINILVCYLTKNKLIKGTENSFFNMVRLVSSSIYGKELIINAQDKIFGPLTCVAGKLSRENNKFVQSIDVRYPTTKTGEQLYYDFDKIAGTCGSSFEQTVNMDPYVTDASHPAIQALLQAYEQVTQKQAKPFAIGGGTYARHFKCAASFGPESNDVELPSWAGQIHGANEAVSEQQLKEAFRIYALAIGKLMQLQL